MKNNEVIISGIHLELTDALKSIVMQKIEKLFKHEEKIIRVRIELEHIQNREHFNEFVAKGQIEIQGPDMIISAASDNLYKSIDLLVDKLNRKIRRRARLTKVKRKLCHSVDISSSLPKTHLA